MCNTVVAVAKWLLKGNVTKRFPKRQGQVLRREGLRFCSCYSVYRSF